MNTQHSVWIMAQVPPSEAKIISKAILFWRTALPTRAIAIFSKDKVCWLSFNACWVNLVRTSICTITSTGPMEETKTAAVVRVSENTACPSSLEVREIGKYCLHGCGELSPMPRENSGCSGPKTQVGTTAKILFHTTSRPLFGLPDKYLGGATS